jgi:hypothetical protein
VNEAKPWRWTAQYTTPEGSPFTIFEASTGECPISLITDESQELLELYHKSKVMREFGVAPFGGDMNKWPARLVDAFMVIRQEEMKVENLMRDVTQSERRQRQKVEQQKARSGRR